MQRINLTEVLGPGDPVARAEIRQQLVIGQKLYDLRTERGLSQAQVARLVGAAPSVIASMEEADYDLHQSQQILQRFTDALASEPPAALAAVASAVGG